MFATFLLGKGSFLLGRLPCYQLPIDFMDLGARSCSPLGITWTLQVSEKKNQLWNKIKCFSGAVFLQLPFGGYRSILVIFNFTTCTCMDRQTDSQNTETVGKPPVPRSGVSSSPWIGRNAHVSNLPRDERTTQCWIRKLQLWKRNNIIKSVYPIHDCRNTWFSTMLNV